MSNAKPLMDRIDFSLELAGADGCKHTLVSSTDSHVVFSYEDDGLTRNVTLPRQLFMAAMLAVASALEERADELMQEGVHNLAEEAADQITSPINIAATYPACNDEHDSLGGVSSVSRCGFAGYGLSVKWGDGGAS